MILEEDFVKTVREIKGTIDEIRDFIDRTTGGYDLSHLTDDDSDALVKLTWVLDDNVDALEGQLKDLHSIATERWPWRIKRKFIGPDTPDKKRVAKWRAEALLENSRVLEDSF